MGISKKQWLKVGLAVAGAVVPGVAQVESSIEALRSKDPTVKKSDALRDLILNSVVAAEGVSAKDFINNPILNQVVQRIIDDVVLLNDLAPLLLRKNGAIDKDLP